MNETLQVLAGFAALGLSIRLGWSIGRGRLMSYATIDEAVEKANQMK